MFIHWLVRPVRGLYGPYTDVISYWNQSSSVILKDDGTDDGTGRSVIRPMGGHRAGLITAGVVPTSVPSCLQRNAQPSRR